MRCSRGVAVLAAVLVATAACGGEDDRRGSAPGGQTALATDEAAFCRAWTAAAAAGDDSALDAALADAPAVIAEPAAIVRKANAGGSESPETEAATAEVLNWTELHCRRGEPGQSQRKIAPPIEAQIEGLTFCGTTGLPDSPDDGRYGMVLYGAEGSDDPYDGPMLGVLWNPADDANHGGDGEQTPVTVRGQSGVAAPITVFQQVILPELGTVIAWTEGGRALGLYGRKWPMDRANELVAIADRLQEDDGGFRIPADALPDGYGEVFAGSPAATSLVFPPSSLYSLRYQGGENLLNLNGLQMTPDEFEAFRFFTVGVDQGEVAGRTALVGNAWNANGPAVVTWREPDGLVVRIFGLGVPLDTAREVASASRELSPAEWAALVEADDRCERPGGDAPRRSDR